VRPVVLHEGFVDDAVLVRVFGVDVSLYRAPLQLNAFPDRSTCWHASVLFWPTMDNAAACRTNNNPGGKA